MPDEPSRLLGLAGLRVTRVLVRDDDALDLEVESVARAGRTARLRWRKPRYRYRGCERSHTEQHPVLPSRQRVSGRFRERLATRAAGGGAHAEIAREEATSRYKWPAPWPW